MIEYWTSDWRTTVKSTCTSHARPFVCHGCRFPWRAEWRLRRQIASRQGGHYCLRADPGLDERSTPGGVCAQQATGHARAGEGTHHPVAAPRRGRGATDARTLKSSVVGSLACCAHRLGHARLHTLVHARHPGRVGNHTPSPLDTSWPRHELSYRPTVDIDDKREGVEFVDPHTILENLTLCMVVAGWWAVAPGFVNLQ